VTLIAAPNSVPETQTDDDSLTVTFLGPRPPVPSASKWTLIVVTLVLLLVGWRLSSGRRMLRVSSGK
jgi:hypothetical protein